MYPAQSPVPDGLTVFGPLFALSLTLTVPLTAPVTTGENVTLMVQLFLLAGVAEQAEVEAANGPVVC